MSVAMMIALGCVVCFVGGLLVGRYYVPDSRQLARSARRSDAYLRALNAVLDHERDAAIAEIQKLVSENTPDLEPYFALGSLFRARGDWERAVRVHQSIALRAPKDKAIQRRTLYALGRDFREAGMPRRAIRALEQCLELDDRHAGALAELAMLYEEQHYYGFAAEARERWARLRREAADPRVHHLYIAGAQAAIQRGDFNAGRDLLRSAQRYDDSSVHVLVACAELAAARGRPQAACKHLVDALAKAPELAPRLVPLIVDAEREHALSKFRGDLDDDTEARALNEQVAAASAVLIEPLIQPGEPHLQLALAELRSHFDPMRALDDYRRLSAAFPRLLPAQIAAARLALASAQDEPIRAMLKHLAGAGGMLDWATEGTWRCSRCNHRQEQFFWRCRDCRAWSTVRLDLGPALSIEPAGSAWQRAFAPSGVTQGALVGSLQRALPAPAVAADGPAQGDFVGGGDRDRGGDGDVDRDRGGDGDRDRGGDSDRDPPGSFWGRVGSWLTGRPSTPGVADRVSEVAPHDPALVPLDRVPSHDARDLEPELPAARDARRDDP